MQESLAQYVIEQPLAARTVLHLRQVVGLFERWTGGSVDVRDMRDDVVNRWIIAMEESGLAPSTVRGRRVALLTIWRAGYDQRRTNRLPGRIRRTNVPLKIPSAWPPEMAFRLLPEATKSIGSFRFWPQFTEGDFWRAFVLVLWDTAFRLGDVLRLKRSDIQPDGTVVLIQAKTAWPHAVRRDHLD